jgi:predicted AlkP superfamily pyrophosphatase or phosphodiesterase
MFQYILVPLKCLRTTSYSRIPAGFRAGILTSLVTLLSIVPGCTPEKIDLHLRPEIVRPPVSVVLFFVDGLDYSALQRLRRFGLTPNISRIFEDGGVRVKNAIDCIPSTTYANTVSLFTGMFPGHHGVVGNSWFDPVDLISTNYMSVDRYQSVNEHFGYKTVYEYLDDRFTFNVQCPTRRGAAQTLDNPLAAGLAYAMKAFVSIDELVGSNIADVAVAANSVGEWPSLLVHYFPGVDEIGHLHGSDSIQYGHAVQNADRQIGRIALAIRDARPSDKIYFILVTDHCHFPVRPFKVMDIDEYLIHECGLRIFSGLLDQSDIAARRSALTNYDAVVLHPSSRHCQIYLRGTDGWGSRPSAEQIQRILIASVAKAGDPLVRHRGIGLVCMPLEPGRVQVCTRHGTAIVERRSVGTQTEYRIAPDNEGGSAEALGYDSNKKLRGFVREGWHSQRAWLDATAASDHPDFVPQIVEFFDSPRAGHIVIFPQDDYAFKGHCKGEHGNCCRRDMRIPMFFAGPDLPHDAVLPCARLVDIVPTILQMLGVENRINPGAPLDGTGLLNELRRAPTD